MNNSLVQYFRCQEHYVQLALNGSPSGGGYFRFGEDTFCYGKCTGVTPVLNPQEELPDAFAAALVDNGVASLPFDLSEIVTNLRHERYINTAGTQGSVLQSAVEQAYYLIRPLMPVGVRKHLQRIRLNSWKTIKVPHWPVDRSVDSVFERVLLLLLRALNVERIPFIWFWPDGAPSCSIMTHDVETASGRDFCPDLMDINEEFGIRSSFQVVPECRYEVTPGYLASIAERGFEVAIHDLNHDGHLYRNRNEFLARAAKINAYGRQWGAQGFRAAVLYRRQEWFDALEFAYDMSVPNVGHLDPQRGGCCTVMPYFVGNILELPVTATQDYTLFHILNDYSIELWKRQIDLIMQKHGMASFIVHPDYITTPRERQTYEALLSHLNYLREESGMWIPTPGEVNRWWRQRAEMYIVEEGGEARIEGEGKERARIAYASEKDGQLVYALDSGRQSGDSVPTGANGKYVEN